MRRGACEVRARAKRRDENLVNILVKSQKKKDFNRAHKTPRLIDPKREGKMAYCLRLSLP
jgi:hypothetical protein